MKKIISMLLSAFLVMPTAAQISAVAEVPSPTISVEQSLWASVGTTIDVPIKIKDNPGILGATIQVEYDNGLTLVGSTPGDAFSKLTMTPPGIYTSPCNFSWDGESLAASDIKDGTILTLQFSVDNDAVANKDYSVKLSYVDGDIVDEDLNAVDVTMSDGAISVIDYKPGDLDGNNKINSTDVILLRRFITGGYGVKINERAANVNGDSRKNSSDVILIRRHITGWNVRLLPDPIIDTECKHSLTHVAQKNPTATEDGNIEYWYCSKCGKYFSDENAKTEIRKDDTVLPATGYTITYNLNTTGNKYLQSIEGEIKNKNRTTYKPGESFDLDELAVEGFEFDGWYTASKGGVRVYSVDENAVGNKTYYAHWTQIPYTVQIKSDTLIDTDTLNYTVDTGVTLPTPKLSNYIFTGWTDEEGHLYRDSIIPAGETGNKILTANWTSERNKTWAKPKLDAPITIEEDNNILFVYEIGKVENVPLYTIKDFGYISGDGVTKTATETYSTTTDSNLMEAYSTTVSNATTESSSWSLSNSWNDTTSVNEQWVKETGRDVGQVDVVAKNTESNWNVSSGRSGSIETSTLSTNSSGWENEVQIKGAHESSTSDQTTHNEYVNDAWNINAKLTYTPKSRSIGIEGIEASTSGGFGGEIGGGYEHKWGSADEETHQETSMDKSEFALSGKKDLSKSSTNSTVESASWNSSQSYGGSSSTSQSKTNSIHLSERISQATGYGHEYAKGEEYSEQQGHISTKSNEDGYSSSVGYSLIEQEEKTNTWTTQATKPGYHRWIVAGTAHVFGVVGYDMLNNSYYTYTYSVMDDETHEFEDYSYSTSAYNDNENGVIPFEIPYEIADYVSERTYCSKGLKVNLNGMVTEYTGEDKYVVIPEYFNTGTGDVVKVTSISPDAFANNENIEAVELSDFITEIPENAFINCTSLVGISGGNIESIGAHAFSGCTAVKECGVPSKVKTLGDSAFDGIAALVVNANNADVVRAAAKSGANEIVISLDYLKDGSSLDNTDIEVPSDTLYFELNGNKNTIYHNVSIKSDADITSINKVNLDCNAKLPLDISSQEIALNQVSVRSNGFAAVFSNDYAMVGLQGIASFISDNENALLSKQIELFESNEKVEGTLAISKNAYMYSEAVNSHLMTGDYRLITAEQFENYRNSRRIVFDANGGMFNGNESNIEQSYALNAFYGEMPRPSRDYYTFGGWYDAPEDGSEIFEDDTVTEDITLYAHWIENDVSEWVLASEMPDDAATVDHKWKYDQTQYIESPSSSLDGWEKYDTKRTGWGSTQGPVYGDPNNGSRNVWSEQYVSSTTRHYKYYHRWNGYSGSSGRWGGDGNSSWPRHTIDITYALSYNMTGTYGDVFNMAYECPVCHAKNMWISEGEYDENHYSTRWYYQDPVYTYYYKKTEHKESTEYPTGDNISNIEEWVQYRVK